MRVQAPNPAGCHAVGPGDARLGALTGPRNDTACEIDLGHQAPESIINVLLLETRSPHDHNVVPTRPLSHAGAGAGGCDADHHVQGGEGGAAPCYPGGGDITALRGCALHDIVCITG